MPGNYARYRTCKMKTLRKITLSDISFSLIVSDENDVNPFEDLKDCMSKEEIKALLEEAQTSNVWKWCNIEVKGIYNGLESSEYLGACSYENEEDFKKDGYYEDMCETVLGELQEQVDAIVKDLIVEN